MDVPTSSYNNPGQPLVSRELLKTACEPFFEQMLTAVQEAVEQQMRSQFQAQAQMRQQVHVQSIDSLGELKCHRTSMHHFQQACQLDPLPDEESTDAEELSGAFASLLSGPTSEDEGSDGVLKPREDESTWTPLPESSSVGEAEHTADFEKSTMVCRHWKSKGWCRLESNCKFLHPENKRGVSAPKGGSKSSALSGCMSGVEVLGITATECPADQLPPAAVGGRRKRRNRSAKEQSESTCSAHGVSDAMSSGNIPCTAFLSAGTHVQMNGCPFILYSATPCA